MYIYMYMYMHVYVCVCVCHVSRFGHSRTGRFEDLTGDKQSSSVIWQAMIAKDSFRRSTAHTTIAYKMIKTFPTIVSHGSFFRLSKTINPTTNPDKTLVEIVEVADHPWFVAVQFHPEFKSKPTAAHPLFAGLVAAAVAHHAGAKT